MRTAFAGLILPLHGRIVPFTELRKTIGRQ